MNDERFKVTRKARVEMYRSQGMSRKQADRRAQDFMYRCPSCDNPVSFKEGAGANRVRREDGGWAHAQMCDGFRAAKRDMNTVIRRQHRDAARLAVIRDGRLA
jgi:hypothetical protein